MAPACGVVGSPKLIGCVLLCIDSIGLMTANMVNGELPEISSGASDTKTCLFSSKLTAGIFPIAESTSDGAVSGTPLRSSDSAPSRSTRFFQRSTLSSATIESAEYQAIRPSNTEVDSWAGAASVFLNSLRKVSSQVRCGSSTTSKIKSSFC